MVDYPDDIGCVFCRLPYARAAADAVEAGVFRTKILEQEGERLVVYAVGDPGKHAEWCEREAQHFGGVHPHRGIAP